jgi:hypothetical protein
MDTQNLRLIRATIPLLEAAVTGDWPRVSRLLDSARRRKAPPGGRADMGMAPGFALIRAAFR